MIPFLIDSIAFVAYRMQIIRSVREFSFKPVFTRAHILTL